MKIRKKVLVVKEVTRLVDVKVVRKCEVCGNEFECKRQDSKYCSRDCSKKSEYIRNSERAKLRAKEWYQNNKEKAQKRRKAYYWSNPEKWRKATKDYYKTHRQEILKKDECYKDKTRHGDKRKELLEMYDYTCQRCGEKKTSFQLVAHHVTHNSQDHENQELLCRSCHCIIHHWS